MKYLLDSNTCIRHLNQRSEAITQRLRDIPETEIVVCSVVKAELYYGAMRSQQPQQTLRKQRVFFSRFVSLPFGDDAAEHYGCIRADLASKGTLIGSNDLLIAAIALAHDLILVTHNTGEFSRVDGLTIEDWES